MSTFKGIPKEFPEIRVDYFRSIPDAPAPLACFLSHVHSDHLIGLESLKSPFVYCSAATRELLLRLEKHPHRLNLAKGILESRIQTYTHLSKLLRPIPLRTPTPIELRPGYTIRVTLFDANHSAGAVSFLIESEGDEDGKRKAIFYTGDVRSEQWWVDQLVREPLMVPYSTASGLRTLDCVYLDTTFVSDLVSEKATFQAFPSKSEGIAELLGKVAKYPKETVFFVEAWTFGYEDVWVALANFLGEKVHLDRYRYGIYSSLARANGGLGCHEAPPLAGFKLGNHRVEGCLTDDPNVRIHSCEYGWNCPVMQGFKNRDVVRIVPIITRTESGVEVHELGIGGGKGDLDQLQEVEIDIDEGISTKLAELCAKEGIEEDAWTRLQEILKSKKLKLPVKVEDGEINSEDITLDEVVRNIVKQSRERPSTAAGRKPSQLSHRSSLPREITFPYSRHSSYAELTALVAALKPQDIYPCTVDEDTWEPSVSMKSLFGPLCSRDEFVHDAEMMARYHQRRDKDQESFRETQRTEETRESQGSVLGNGETETFYTPEAGEGWLVERLSKRRKLEESQFSLASSDFCACESPHAEQTQGESQRCQINHLNSQEHIQEIPKSKKNDRSIKQWAYMAVTGLDEDCDSWEAFGGLSCVKQQEREMEL